MSRPTYDDLWDTHQKTVATCQQLEAENKRLRASVNEDERQLCYLSCWIDERFGVNTNTAICDLDSPPEKTVARVIARTVDAEVERLQKALQRLCEYAGTCKTHNTHEWMEGLEEIVNRRLEMLGDKDRIRFLVTKFCIEKAASAAGAEQKPTEG